MKLTQTCSGCDQVFLAHGRSLFCDDCMDCGADVLSRVKIKGAASITKQVNERNRESKLREKNKRHRRQPTRDILI